MRAAAWMSGAIVSFSAMAVAGRAVASELDTFELMLYRSLIGLGIVLLVSSLVGTRRQINTRDMPLHLIRNISHFIGQNLWFFAITVTPLAQVFALEFTSPLWVLLFSPLLLGERLTRVRSLCAVLGFLGILIVVRPSADSLSPGIIAAAIAAIGFAGSAVFTKMLTRRQSITCILFYLTLMQAVFGLLAAGYDGDITLPSTIVTPWLLLIALAGLLAHFCLTKALTIAPASVVIPIDFIRLPVIAVIGMVLYGEAVDVYVFIGGLVIFVANYVNILHETRFKISSERPGSSLQK